MTGKIPTNISRFAAAFMVIFALVLGGTVLAQDAQPAQQPPAAPAPAQPQPTQQPQSVLADQETKLADLVTKVDEIDKRIVANAENDEVLVNLRLQLEDILAEALATGVAFRPRLSEINARLEQLGPAPAAGQEPESERVASERKALTTEKAEINVSLGKAEDLSVRINGLLTKIANLRQQLFTDQLTKRVELNDAISRQVVTDLATEGQIFRNRIWSSLRFAFRFKLSSLIAATALSLLAAAIIQFGGKRLFGNLMYRDPEIEHPTYVNRLSVAFWSSLLPAFALMMCFLLALALFDWLGVFSGDLGAYLGNFFSVILIGFIVNRISRAVLSPDMPNWRLIRIEAGPARTLVWLITALGVVVGMSDTAEELSRMLGSPISVTIVKSLVAAIVSGMLIIAIARVKPFLTEDGRPRAWPGWFGLTLFILGVGSILAALSGYISLAQFVSEQIVVTGALVTTAYIGLATSSAISEEGGLARTSVGQWLKTRYEADDTRLDQLGVLSSVAINIAIVIIFMPLVLFQWNFQPGDIAAWIRRAASGFQVGTFSFSPFAIITGLMVFALGYFVTRWFQRWLDGTVMARGKVDLGVRNSIRTVVGYAGLAIAALIAVSSAGLDLSNLAIIAGGLSLGIGFGLQNIVSNFVSGLILLAERPFKVGDWVEAGSVSGTVKKISVRATEIETFQRQTIIMPNSLFINGAVGNWTHRNKLGRVEVPVGVVYGSDAKKVHDVLLEIAKGHPMVLKNPEPMVLFQGFSDIAMLFEVRAFLADIGSGATVRNDIRFALVDAFKREDIELAYTLKPDPAPAKEDWPHDDDKAEAELMAQQDAKAKAPDPAAKGKRKRHDPA